uniref:Nucleocapsid protein n=1 Tax=Culex phasma-like virus TaxID=2010276 RepID=A0A6B9KH06_9VIRU|nr:nucleocapsid protein [Culex phasma-like virus]
MENVKIYTGHADLALPEDAEAKRKILEVIDAQADSAAALCKTNLVKDAVIQFVKLSDLAGEISGARLDVPDLIAEVAKILPSILDNYTWRDSYKALDVMRRIIYNIGPETRSVKKGKNADINWRLRITEVVTPAQIAGLNAIDFEKIAADGILTDQATANNTRRRGEIEAKWTSIKDGVNYATAGAIVVSTFKSTSAPTSQPKLAAGNVLLLTVKQATIVGLYILEKFTKVACEKNHDILTPLSGAVFSRDSLTKMMQDPVIAAAFGAKCKLVDAINKSAQNGGQFLEGSRADVAAVCVLIGTANVKKQEERKSIVQRTMKQYFAQKREGSKDVFKAMLPFGTGGLPEEWTFDVLSDIQETSRRQSQALRLAASQAIARTNAGLIPDAQTPETSGN